MVNLKLSTTIDVAKQALGVFTGWPMANDWHHPTMPQSTQNCCTVNCSKALYEIWRYMMDYDDGRLRVHLLYQRGHYWGGETLWTKVERFVPEDELEW